MRPPGQQRLQCVESHPRLARGEVLLCSGELLCSSLLGLAHENILHLPKHRRIPLRRHHCHELLGDCIHPARDLLHIHGGLYIDDPTRLHGQDAIRQRDQGLQQRIRDLFAVGCDLVYLIDELEHARRAEQELLRLRDALKRRLELGDLAGRLLLPLCSHSQLDRVNLLRDRNGCFHRTDCVKIARDGQDFVDDDLRAVPANQLLCDPFDEVQEHIVA
mmetsp:Transcript_13926/g.37978  ORF Transcript_13926/g.37978 Transcript_13926/m.37978 type:complete len:218 (-) Transcript_13926:280-933(-)